MGFDYPDNDMNEPTKESLMYGKTTGRKTDRSYEVTFNGETRQFNSSRKGLVQAGIGVFEDGSWFHATTTKRDPKGAAAAARSVNHYAVQFTAAAIREIPYRPAAELVRDNATPDTYGRGVDPIENARALVTEIGDDLEAVETTGGLLAAGVALMDVSDANGEGAVDEADELLGELSVIYNAVVGNDDDEMFVGGLYIQAVEAAWTERQS